MNSQKKNPAAAAKARGKKTPLAPRPPKKPAPKKAAPRRAPVLLEITYTLFMLIVIGAGLATASLSLMAEADLLMVVVRTGGVLLLTGLILWIVYWLIANGVVEARRQQVLEEARQQKAAAAAADQAQSTVEFEA